MNYCKCTPLSFLVPHNQWPEKQSKTCSKCNLAIKTKLVGGNLWGIRLRKQEK